jgi:beta-glucosidase
MYRNSKFLIYFFIASHLLYSCNQEQNNSVVSTELNIEQKVDSLLALMTLDEKIGQMTQVRHFDDISEGDVATKFIGSVIHTQGALPGKGAVEWQARMSELQKEALSTRAKHL